MIRIYSVLVALAVSWTLSADVLIVEDGKPAAEIVIPEKANRSVHLAAEDLQNHLKLISGAGLDIVTKTTGKFKNKIYVGEGEHTKKLGFQPAKFTNSGFEIIAKDNYVILNGPDIIRKEPPFRPWMAEELYLENSNFIDKKMSPKPDYFPSKNLKSWWDFCGEKFSTLNLLNGYGAFNTHLKIHFNDDTCTWYAVCELLEQLGVRWYMWEEHGTVIPELKTIAVKEQQLKKQAAFQQREWYFGGIAKSQTTVPWLKRLKMGNRNMIIFNHTTYDVFSNYEQQKEHPEYLSRNEKGTFNPGFPAGRGYPYYGGKEFREAALKWMRKVFDAIPEYDGLTMGFPDGAQELDDRDVKRYGKPGYSHDQIVTDCIWDFYVYLARELKKSHPDKKFLAAVYKMQGTPPKFDSLPDNIVIAHVEWHSAATERGLKALEDFRNKQFDFLRKHGVTPAKGPRWDYWLYYFGGRTRWPHVFSRSLQKQMKESLSYSYGKFIETSGELKGGYTGSVETPGLLHLMAYWQTKLLWDPDADRQSIFDEYYKLFFGSAENEMREFYEFAEEVWSRPGSRSVTPTTGFATEKDVDKYFEILARARAKAGKDSVYDKRIALIEKELEPLKKLFPNLKRTGPTLRIGSFQKPVALDGNMSKYSRDYWWTMRDMRTGDTPAKNRTEVSVFMTSDRKYLMVAAVCYENRMKELKAKCKSNDDRSIFEDDVLEIYLNSPQHSYFKIVVNSSGAIFDETTDGTIIDRETLPILWTPGVEVKINKFDDRWTAEVKIPTKDLGNLGPNTQYPWGVQLGRTRLKDNQCETWAISPSGTSYNTTNLWASIWMR